jgi:hypothetical protein
MRQLFVYSLGAGAEHLFIWGYAELLISARHADCKQGEIRGRFHYLVRRVGIANTGIHVNKLLVEP